MKFCSTALSTIIVFFVTQQKTMTAFTASSTLQSGRSSTVIISKNTNVLASTTFNNDLINVDTNENIMTTKTTTSLSSRRDTLMKIFGRGSAVLLATALMTTTTNPIIVNALDIDAFVNAELDSDTKNCDPKKDSKCIPKLSQDEALCKYGQSGTARGEACKRVKDSGGILDKPGSQGGRSLGGAYAM